MRSNRQLGVVLLTLLPVVAALGCNDTKVLPLANGRLSAKVVMDPPAGPRADTLPPFTWGEGIVTAVVFKPVAITERQTYGREGIDCLEANKSADLIVTSGSDLQTVTVPAGVYNLDRIAFNNFVLSSDPGDPLVDLDRGRCSESGVVSAFSISVTASSSGSRSFPPGQLVQVTVPQGGQALLTIVIDGAGLASVLDTMGSCIPDPSSPTGYTYQRNTVPFYPADVSAFVSYR